MWIEIPDTFFMQQVVRWMLGRPSLCQVFREIKVISDAVSNCRVVIWSLTSMDIYLRNRWGLDLVKTGFLKIRLDQKEIKVCEPLVTTFAVDYWLD